MRDPVTLEAETRAVIGALELSPHPEGGYFRETFRAPAPVGGARASSTAIYFLLPAGRFSAWHEVDADEAWHFYGGAPLALHTIEREAAPGPGGATGVHRVTHRVTTLGMDLAAGERPQAVVPAGALQAAVPLGGPHSLCGCTVAPGFEFAGFVLPTREALRARFAGRGDLEELIERFTRA